MSNKQTSDNVLINKTIWNILADCPWLNHDKIIEAPYNFHFLKQSPNYVCFITMSGGYSQG